MAGTPTVLLQNGSNTDASLYNTATSAAPGTGKILLFIENGFTGGTVDPSGVTGMGLVWTKRKSSLSGNSNVGGSMWEGAGSPVAGALAITMPSLQSHCAWMVVEVPDATTLIQSHVISTAATNPSISLPSAPGAASAVLAQLVGNSGSSIVYTPSHTVLGTRTDLTGPTGSRLAQYDIGSPPQSMSWTTTSAVTKVLIIAEVGGSPAASGIPKYWNESAELTPTQLRWWNESAEVAPTLTWWNGSAEVPIP